MYIEELAELILASCADMSSSHVKPDKSAILEAALNQIRSIRDQETASASDAVQQGEVSSSKPTILTNDVFCPLLLEALEGFVFVVNTEGKVEFVTDNISQFIKFNKDDVLGKSIYNILHHGDHGRFSACLLPMWSAIEAGGGGNNSTVATTGLGPSQSRNRTFNCRFLIKPPDDNEQTTMEEKQQRVSKYEYMQISSTQLPQNSGGDKDDEGNEVGPCLMCVARRIPSNEKHPGTAVEQFTTKLDIHGKVIGVDTSSVSANYLQHLSKELTSRPLEELCHPHDASKLTSHLKEVLTHGQNNTPLYHRLRIGVTHDKYLYVHTKSRLFKSSNSQEHDFIMATHSIIGENELVLSGSDSGSSSISHGSHSSSSSSGVGGPLIANVNGSNQRSVTSELTPMSLSNSVSSYNPLHSTELDFGFDLLNSTSWELPGEERVTWERPESRASLTPAPSPLYTAPTQPSPALTSTAFPFSPPLSHPGAGDTDEKESDEPGSESGRLRNLLLTKRPSTDSEESSQSSRNKHRILKGLLNQDEEDQHDPKPASNNMLLKLLNEKSDDDDVEARAGLKKQNELLQQLLKEEENNAESSGGGVVVVSAANDDPLLKGLGFRSGTSSPAESIGRGGRKRPSSEDAGGSQEEGNATPLPPKRASVSTILDTLPPSTSAPTSGNSKLCEKNRMLASLLAQRPSTPATIPPVPASIISATPQDKLPRLIRPGWSGGSVQQTQQSPQPVRNMQRSPAPQLQQQQQQQQQQLQQQHQQQQQQQQQRVSVHCTTGISRPQPTWDNQSSDPVLSDLLDQVIEIVPEAITDSPALMNMINSAESPSSAGQSGQFQQDLSEKMAINAIQKSLMLCETAVKNPSFNTQTATQAQNTGGQQFQPPPMYQQQRQRLPIAQAQLRQAQYNLANQQQQQQQHLLRNKMLQAQQQQERKRLLQLQQHQQLLIPSNATANEASGLHNIDTLMNNSVAPNVALQRSASVPDSQLSPVGSYPGTSGTVTGSGGQTPTTPTMITTATPSQISPSQRQPYSPQPFSPVNGGMNSFQNSGGGQQGGGSQQPSPVQQSRLSPTSLQSFQQAQLSPRLSQGQQGYGGSQTQSTSWSQQQAARLSMQQQQNPMLNAQLTGGNYSTAPSSVRFTSTTPPAGSTAGGNASGGGASNRLGVSNSGGQLPPVRSLTSPGSRQSPFPPELSPTTASSYQFRLQRTISAPPPQATTHLPGSTAARVYGGKEVPPLVSPSPYHHPQPHQIHHHHHHQTQQLLYDHHHQQQAQQQPYCYEGYHHPHPSRHQAPPGGGGGGGNNGVVTEYVRQELRAMVGARTGGSSRNSGSGSGSTTPAHVGLSPHHQVPSVDLDSLTMAFDIQPQGVAESPKMWSTMGDMGNASPQSVSTLPSRSPMEEVNRSNDQKSSLLQKLLSE
ncbi:hypothetical protein O3M35_005428 [Rhynocoris fuscipes]|uniref:PAS domain-containing protein n=1 Tax=Rhynocoris fuscipes TaxID=488301 RepID=A0AAW1DK25_9HEMI